jgi:AP-4 complex subunit mu-1
MDYGVPQCTNTDYLKTFVLNTPVVVAPSSSLGPAGRLLGFNKGPTGVFKSVLDTSRSGKKDEIFVDVVERVTCTFNSSGFIVSQQVDGSVQIKSYLAGNPPIKIKLNDNLVIGKKESGFRGVDFASQAVHLDDCSFHECANLDQFETERTISLVPPDGEFALINYCTTHGFKPPFRMQTIIEADPVSDNKAYLTINLWCEVPSDKSATGLEIEVPTPRYVQRIHCDLEEGSRSASASSQSWDYSEKTHLLKWKFKKCQGGCEYQLRARLTLERPYGPSLRSEVGPINLKFSIPTYSASRIALKYLQIMKPNADKNYNPQRWVRYVTSSSSYVFRT